MRIKKPVQDEELLSRESWNSNPAQVLFSGESRL